MKHVAIIGSTGSIGTQTLEIARWNQDIKICALSAGRNIDLLEKQAREFRPEIVGLWDEKLADELKRSSEGYGYPCRIRHGWADRDCRIQDIGYISYRYCRNDRYPPDCGSD